MISVIIPVYNCEKYLENSIKSLINQTIFEDLELIFVNDGSTDSSSKIIEKYLKKYKNIVLINQNNKGVSAARNAGIKKATGEYICFFDGDDIADKELYETLHKIINQNDYDLCCINYNILFSEKNFLKKRKKIINKILCNENILKSFFKEDYIGINIFDKMFKTEIVRKISFPEGYAIGEDMFFVYQYLKLSERIIIDSSVSLYDYCIHENSAMKSSFSKKNLDNILLAKSIMEDLKENKECFFNAEANYIHEICKALSIYYRNANYEYEKEIKKYKQDIKKYSLIKAFKHLRAKHFLGLILMKISPKLYLIIYDKFQIG